MVLYEIPTVPAQRRITVSLGGTVYGLRFGYIDTDDGGWFIDLSNAAGAVLVAGIPMVTGADLLEPYGYLGVPGRLYVGTDGDPAAVPTFAGLGSVSHLFFKPFAS